MQLTFGAGTSWGCRAPIAHRQDNRLRHVVGFMKIGRVGSTDHENTIEKSPKGGESFNLKHRFGGRFW